MTERLTERASPVVQTKLQPPPLRDDVVARPRLLDRLCATLRAHRLTLVSAPAGSGKTTLLAALPGACPELAVAWLALDEEDNDPARFLGALVAALERTTPGCALTAQSLLASLADPGAQPRRVIGVLINDLAETLARPCVLVLDDFHLVTTPALYDALDYLLERLPPHLHIVVSTRHDPPLALARLRARRHLAEFRLAELRFTPDESGRFLTRALAGQLSDAQQRALHDRVEGWAAGLSLAVSALEAMPTAADRDAWLAHLAAGDRYVFDFLADEVLERQETRVRDFLLRTAILTELTPTLCAAVTGQPDATALLAELHRRNLFVLALGGPGGAYRYHDLFRTFLREQLARAVTPEDLCALHRRAAAAATEPIRAIRHWLAAAAWEEASQAIETHGESLLAQGALDTLRGLIMTVPETVRVEHPRLIYFLGLCAYERLDLLAARELLATAAQGLEASGDGIGRGEALVHLATTLSTMADLTGAAGATARAVAGPLTPRGQVQLLLGRAWQQLGSGDADATNATLDEILALAGALDDPWIVRRVAYQVHTPFGCLPGGVARLEQFSRLVRARAGEMPSPSLAAALGWQVFAHIWRGRWVEAAAVGEDALAMHERVGSPLWARFDAAMLMPVLHALRGETALAERALDSLFRDLAQPAVQRAMTAWLPLLVYLWARTRWLEGDRAGVREGARRLREAAGTEWPILSPVRPMMEALLALVDGRRAEAETALRQAAALQRQRPGSAIAGDAGLLLAWLSLDQGRRPTALALLAPLLAAHEREGTPGALMWEGASVAAPLLRFAAEQDCHRQFVAEVQRLITAAGLESRSARATLAVPDTGETLTPREVEVLRLVAEGASNATIAERLAISVHTVKIHVARILAKLGVESRGQAASRARDLGLA